MGDAAGALVAGSEDEPDDEPDIDEQPVRARAAAASRLAAASDALACRRTVDRMIFLL
ncbi:hypothetical protein JCM13591A_36660 [Microbacterium xylanilyticum]